MINTAKRQHVVAVAAAAAVLSDQVGYIGLYTRLMLRFLRNEPITFVDSLFKPKNHAYAYCY